jgi:hypothetical protein
MFVGHDFAYALFVGQNKLTPPPPPPVIPKLRPWVATVVQVLIKSQLAIAQQCFVEQAKQGH